MKRAILILSILFLSLNSFSQKSFYKELNESIPAVVYSDTLPNGFVLITDIEELKYLYIGLYEERSDDGFSYFEDFRGSLIIKHIQGIYTYEEINNLEVYVKLVQDELILGNWITAQSVNQNLSLSGIYTQTMKDEIQLYIDTYVVNNY
jgi:hypothetical protein